MSCSPPKNTLKQECEAQRAPKDATFSRFYLRAWKDYDFKTLDRLQEQGPIACRRANKSVTLTNRGLLFGDAHAAPFRTGAIQTLKGLEGLRTAEEGSLGEAPDAYPRQLHKFATMVRPLVPPTSCVKSTPNTSAPKEVSRDWMK